ncbi:MAG: hypothetical protein ABIU05_17285 [Nitrospirales bacterium]
MSTAKAQRMLLDRLGAAMTALMSIHLSLSTVPDWCDGEDADGLAVLLVGKHSLGTTDAAQAFVAGVLAALRAGEVPAGVLPIRYAPKASAFIAEVVAGILP